MRERSPAPRVPQQKLRLSPANPSSIENSSLKSCKSRLRANNSFLQDSELSFDPKEIDFEDKQSISSIEHSSQTYKNTLMDSFSGLFTPAEASSVDVSEPEMQSGYDISRFPDELDQFFICAVCEKVLYQPRECTVCQNLLCAQCLINLNSCPYGCPEFEFVKPSKFALIFYLRNRICCMYFSHGCSMITAIKDIEKHEDACKFKPVRCSNPVCSETVLLEEEDAKEEILCSDVCRILLEYAKSFREMSRYQRLDQFAQIMQMTRKLLMEETKQELAEDYKLAESLKQEFDKFLIRRERLKQQIANAQKRHHCGEWDSQEWSCCGKSHMHAQGCQLLP